MLAVVVIEALFLLEPDPHQHLPDWVSQRSGMLPPLSQNDGTPPTDGVVGSLSASSSASPRLRGETAFSPLRPSPKTRSHVTRA